MPLRSTASPAAKQPAPVDLTPRKDARLEFVEQGGVLRALQYLADAIREAGNDIAHHVESLAWEVDRERRGALSVGGRSDWAEVANTVESLLHEPLLTPADRHQVLRDVLEAQPKPGKTRPKPKPKTNPPRRSGARMVKR